MHRVVVIGNGYEAALAAALFHRLGGGNWGTIRAHTGAVTGARRASWGAVGGGFWPSLGAVQGTYPQFGVRFDGWGPGGGYFQPEGGFGEDMEGIGFHHYWLRLAASGGSSEFGRFSAETMAAAAGRTGGAGTVADVTALTAWLEGLAPVECAGVLKTVRHENGRIAGLELVDGQVVEGEVYIDASDEGAAIGALSAAYVDWRQWLPCDRIAVAEGAATVQTVIATEAAGWRWSGPAGCGRVFDSRYSEGGTAVRPGYRPEMWTGNVVAVGPAAGWVEPLDTAPWALLQAGLERLMAVAPGPDVPPVKARYNREMAADYAAWRDFSLARYVLAARQDTAFWQERRRVELPESLRERFDMFARAGHIHAPHTEPFSEGDWFALFAGHGFLPRSWHPVADLMSDNALKLRMAQVRTAVQAKADAL